jgi:hypothetical protein
MTRQMTPTEPDETVFFDLDSTLADTRQRWGLINEEDPDSTDWVAYAQACADDVPFAGPAALIRLLWKAGYRVVILTGRSGESEGVTRKWLMEHSIPFDHLVMREKGNKYEANGPWKARKLKEFVKAHPRVKPVLMVDDWPDVKIHVEAAGVPVLTFNPLYKFEETEAERVENREGQSATNEGAVVGSGAEATTLR